MTTEPSPTVRLSRVTKSYGQGHTAVTALCEADLDISPGELVAVVGPSGSGKSTLLAVIGGLVTPDSGTVEVGGVNVSALPQGKRAHYRATTVGFVFQSLNLVPFLTARENLLFMASLAGIPKRAAGRRADELLEKLGLAGRGGDLPGMLSGGEQQRVAIARALIHEPAVLLADEPTASLDTELGTAVVRLLAEEIRRRDMAGVLVTHDRRMTAAADRTVTVLDGKLHQTNTMEVHSA